MCDPPVNVGCVWYGEPMRKFIHPALVLICLIGFSRLSHADSVAITSASATSEVVAPVLVTEASALDQRLAQEAEWRRTGLLILPYRPNYLLAYSNNFNGNTSVGQPSGSPAPQDIEAKFQISLRMPIARGLFWNHGDVQLAYTQVSFWQVYNKAISAPFRETTYEPEVMLTFDSGLRLLGSTRQSWAIGGAHQSNGRSAPDSRSWNRAYMQGMFARGNGMILIKPWIRLTETAREDDNPDILHYMGHFELRGAYKLRQQVGAVMIRNNLDSAQNKGAVELSYSFPLLRLLRGYVQYFNGYGESLIDYNRSAHRLSAGLAFSDWL